MYNNREYQYSHISGGGTTTVVSAGRVNLGGICINSTTAIGAIQVITGTSTVVGIIGSTVAAGVYLQGLSLSNGLTVITNGASGTPDITVKYTQG